MRTQCRIMRDGLWVGRRPWGYLIAGTKYNKSLVIDPELERYVIEVFDRAVRGESLRKIARWLESEGVPSERGNSAWSDVAARQVIMNSTYSKEWLRKQRIMVAIEDGHPELVFMT
jgi:hypothetical protein